ncbi:MAG: 23S rRNA (adenine(2503)-C(2))-methyltransferase RlmN [Prevotella sp.]|nr:23S rRNA (adenine(2503)-C(2))-methyltransferase RlmN [Candidatus Equicola stercoris]
MENIDKKNVLLGLTLHELQALVIEFGMPAFTAKQITQWLYQKQAVSFDDMTNISKANRQILEEHCVIGRMEPIKTLVSKDKTEKYLFPTIDGQYVETVMIPDHDRATLCVSCQIGCKMNCLFCQTGKQGFHGDLTPADILNQIISVNSRLIEDGKTPLTNIVYMGQGEPLDNLDNVMKTLDILTADYGWAWSPKRITVSTCGIKKGLRRFLEESECNLAISLHSPIHEQRESLMPAEKAYPMDAMIKDLMHYFPRNEREVRQRRLSFEYIVFDGFNDSNLHLKELVKLLSPLDCRINLIRWHRIPDIDMNTSDEKRLETMRDYLTAHGIFTTIRASRGEDIFAACGLLSTAEQR